MAFQSAIFSRRFIICHSHSKRLFETKSKEALAFGQIFLQSFGSSILIQGVDPSVDSKHILVELFDEMNVTVLTESFRP